MPTIAIIGPYRFFFYSSDGAEPYHVHVKREEATAKFWLIPVRIARSSGFSGREMQRIARLVAENEVRFLRKWHDYFGD